MLNEKNSENSSTSDFLYSAALEPNAIGPTFPPLRPFSLPTGPTGSIGRFILSLLIIINLSILLKR
ncbi:hypothetical protein CO726_26235 [Bacillus fungorum]|uniref:Exosporium leader peptide n=1 Tax=Bacillus fungorum TaxID=2039284 RepID=A0A2G6Q6K0_9BACI|nr:hypothetical protein CO726_26235 [Bacillus fungorum]